MIPLSRNARSQLPLQGIVPQILLAVCVLVGSLLLYGQTAAPDVLSGDSGEFQFAAPLLAIPHPTGYPLYILFGKLATLVPFGPVAYRVTLVSVVAGSCAVAVASLLFARVTGSLLAALVAAIALAVSPGLWNAATLAEVYALVMLLLVGLAWSLWMVHEQRQAADDAGEGARAVCVAACLTGLGVSLHGSFVVIGAPLLFVYGVVPLLVPRLAGYSVCGRRCWRLLARSLVWGAVGLLPWAFVFVRYAQLGPFNGFDHGLHRFSDVAHPTYFWGAPTHWGEALDHIFGGVMRGGVFHIPDAAGARAALAMVYDRLWFEFGLVGCIIGAIGCVGMLVCSSRLWVGAAWVAVATVVYFVFLGRAVQDALVFTLPLVLPMTLWIGYGAVLVGRGAGEIWRRMYRHDRVCVRAREEHVSRHTLCSMLHLNRFAQSVLLILLLATIAWGVSRWPYANKAHLSLFRTFGEGVLVRLDERAVVMVRWEQGTILQYLRLVEGLRPDVWVDIVEPGDEAWLKRAQRRYADDPVYIIGSTIDGAETGAQRVWGTDYAVLFRLR